MKLILVTKTRNSDQFPYGCYAYKSWLHKLFDERFEYHLGDSIQEAESGCLELVQDKLKRIKSPPPKHYYVTRYWQPKSLKKKKP